MGQRLAHSPIRQNVAVRYNEGCCILDLIASHQLFVALYYGVATAENGNAKTVFSIARRGDRNDALCHDELKSTCLKELGVP